MSTQDVIERHLAAFNARDRDADPWTADAEMVAPGAAVQGRDAVLGFLGVFQEAFPDGRLSVHRWVVDGTDAAVEGRFVGTHDGVLHAPDGDVPPTGRPVEFRWSAAYEVRGDELASEHLYFDQVELLSALGLLPGPA
ncbi:ester cyclase [Patulibacter sp. S7RM1-6]